MLLIEQYLKGYGYKIERKKIGQPPHNGFSFVTSPSGKLWITLSSAPTLPFQTSSSQEIRSNKIRSYAFAKMVRMRIPATIQVNPSSYEEQGLQSFIDTHQRVIVKPFDSCQSKGLTTDIIDIERLKQAVVHAAEISKIVIIQEQVDGEEIRLISVDGRIKAALLRQKPQVIGDGVSTLSELIREENAMRTRITGVIVGYPQLTDGMVPSEYLSSLTVPSAGQVVKLSNKTMIRDGASVYDVMETIDHSYIEIAERATMQFGEGFTCVDLMIQDFTRPASEDNYAFIEFNGNPSIAMCYSCRDGKQFRILEEHLGPKLVKALP